MIKEALSYTILPNLLLPIRISEFIKQFIFWMNEIWKCKMKWQSKFKIQHSMRNVWESLKKKLELTGNFSCEIINRYQQSTWKPKKKTWIFDRWNVIKIRWTMIRCIDEEYLLLVDDFENLKSIIVSHGFAFAYRTATWPWRISTTQCIPRYIQL